MFKHKVRELVKAAVSLAAAFGIGGLAIYLAYVERGYWAVGGEYFVIIIAGWAAWKLIH